MRSWLSVSVGLLGACGPAPLTVQAPCDVPPTLALQAAPDGVAPGQPGLFEVRVDNGCDRPAPVSAELDGAAAFTLAEVPRQMDGQDVVRVAFAASSLGTYEARLTVTVGQAPATVELRATVASDADGDGFDGVLAGGEDCDDTDPDAFPGAPERGNAQDDDCDGWIDEDQVGRDDVRITEVFARPSAGDLRRSLWVEVYNASTTVRYLDGWTVRLGASDLVVEGGSSVEPGRYAVLALEPQAVSAAGVTDARPLEGEAPAPGWRGAELRIEAVVWRGDGVMDEAFVPGRSLGVSGIDANPDVAANWCSATSRMPSRERGTPGAPNDACALADLDEDSDGFSPATGDCDDGDPQVRPGAIERWNRRDDDCDGTIDVLTTLDAGGGLVADRLVWSDWAQHGDFDADGFGRVFLASDTRTVRMYGDGELLDPTTARYSTIRFYAVGEGTRATDNPWAPPTWPDLDDDGVSDAIFYASERTGRDHVFIWSGEPGGGSSLYADLVLHGDGSRAHAWTGAHADVDGDGRPSLLRRHEEGALYLDDVDGLTGVVSADDLTSPGWEGAALGWTRTGDFDGDGYDDVIVEREREELRWHVDLELIRGDRSASGDPTDPDLVLERVYYTATDDMRRPDVDLDGDGDVDLLAATPDRTALLLFDADGSGRLTVPDADGTLPPTTLRRPVTDDLDGDGQADLILSPYDAGAYRHHVVYGPISLTGGTIETLGQGSFDGSSQMLVVDVDGDGDRDVMQHLYGADAWTLLPFLD